MMKRYSWTEGWHEDPANEDFEYCVEDGKLKRWRNTKRNAYGHFYVLNKWTRCYDLVTPVANKRNYEKDYYLA